MAARGLRRCGEVQVNGIVRMLGQQLLVLFDRLGTIGLHAADANPLVFLMQKHLVGAA